MNHEQTDHAREDHEVAPPPTHHQRRNEGMMTDNLKAIEDGIEAEQRRMNVHKFLDSMRPTINLREMIQKGMDKK